MSEYDLISACWTTAGACEPMAADDRSPLDVTDRVRAAARAGFRGFGIRHGDLMRVEQTLGFADFRRLLDDHGMRHLEFEFLEGWYDTGEVRRLSDVRRADFLRAAEALGARHIKVGGHLAGGTVDVDRVAEELHRLGADAAEVGTKVGIEPMPFADITTPAMGLEIVQRAGHPAAGLFIDVWHVARAGVDVASLAELPGELLFGIELDDARAEVEGTLLEDTFNGREFPGEGVLDVQGFVDAIQRTGYQGPWGVEMLSTAYRRLPLEEAVQRAYDTAIRFLDRTPATDRASV
ncbi:sugar phosphate isomerase/epimerase family protein [Nakamurella leprariae]|uniref:Sugar phosphate isomerase/epimerase n=1 Tax=Nakamurella leprariae TaxID=2803911 RepID=A0A938Y883_9ACTN|nr:sugar phosphate isomerase/epimerase family protein [Nakamurella leprariae]MBM9467836.1 sugar phosphate isomerase/epimerase [Nakamurella leprariae]